jgi:integrase
MNTDAVEIRIAGWRMKMEAPRVVPVSRQAIELIEANAR